ncbi:Reticulocyte-binding protein 2 homolog a [Geodia barretti]|uniref:Reticulocyte-binding protein 2 homolog a n=1 Tax=Geodia barretti TaxID=519541 RepID=A0AA35TV55_GEOBA|nr:Reticulocyte-binding protein 2 homolog a [Geodia barretti]
MNKLELLQALQTQPRNQEELLQSSEREKQIVVQQLQSKNQENAELQQQLESSEREKQTVRQQLISSQRQNQELRQRETEVQAKDRELREKQTVRDELTRKERELAETRQKEEQLRSSEALVADLQKAQRDSETRRTKTQPASLAIAVPHAQPPAVKPRKLTVQCRRKKPAPRAMASGSATTDGRFAYFNPGDSNSVYQYECSTEKWEELPSCPYQNSGLVLIDGKLTAVGGWDGCCYTNKLYTLRRRKWVEKYPPMNTARSNTAVVTTSDGEYLIAIGEGDDWPATVELFQVKSRRWYQLTDLPRPLPSPSATICGDQLNVIGTDANGYSFSLAALPSSDQPITSPLTLSWKPLPPLPVADSTAATLCGQLVLIGGRRDVSSLVKSIHQLVDGQWVEIGSMTSDRRMCLVVSPSPHKITIVGGDAILFPVDVVEECIVTQ